MQKETNEVFEPLLQFHNDKTRRMSKRTKIIAIVSGSIAALILILGLGLGLGLRRKGGEQNETIECAENVNISSKNIKVIDSTMFKNCKALRKITFDSGTNVTKIATRAFEGSTIKEVYLPETITSIESYAFANSDLRRIYFKGDELSIIEKGTFMYTKLDMISLPKSIEVIEDSAFEGCVFLQGAGFALRKTNLKIIGKRAFYNCSKLLVIDDVPALQSVGDFAFANTNLFSFCCYPSLVTIGDYAFSENNVFISFDTQQCLSLETIGAYSFYNTNIRNIIVPNSVKNISTMAFGSSSLDDHLEYVEFPAESQIKSLDPSAFINRIYKICVLTLNESIRNYIRNSIVVSNINVTEECRAD